MIRVAGIQICANNNPVENLEILADAMEQSQERGANLLVLPENFACYGGSYRELAEEHADFLQSWLANQARQLGVWVLGGTMPLHYRPDGSPVPGGRVRAASLLYNPDGQQVARYDKLHLFDAEVDDAQGRYCESDVFEPGDELVCAQVGDITLGLAVCYDLRFPAQARALADRGATLLVYPSAFTEVTGRAHWEVLLRARAVETGCYVLGVNQCGRHSDVRSSYGHSMLCGPWGEVLVGLEDHPAVLCGDILPRRVAEVRKQMPIHDHTRFLTGLPDDIRDHYIDHHSQ